MGGGATALASRFSSACFTFMTRATIFCSSARNARIILQATTIEAIKVPCIVSTKSFPKIFWLEKKKNIPLAHAFVAARATVSASDALVPPTHVWPLEWSGGRYLQKNIQTNFKRNLKYSRAFAIPHEAFLCSLRSEEESLISHGNDRCYAHLVKFIV